MELLSETDYWQSIKRIEIEVLDYLQIFAKDIGIWNSRREQTPKMIVKNREYNKVKE